MTRLDKEDRHLITLGVNQRMILDTENKSLSRILKMDKENGGKWDFPGKQPCRIYMV